MTSFQNPLGITNYFLSFDASKTETSIVQYVWKRLLNRIYYIFSVVVHIFVR